MNPCNFFNNRDISFLSLVSLCFIKIMLIICVTVDNIIVKDTLFNGVLYYRIVFFLNRAEKPPTS